MHPLFHVIYAAHAAGTHHKLALDALRHLECAGSGRWQRVFLLHAGLYLEGVAAPGEGGEDFGGHARDGSCGAPGQVGSWYRHVVEALGLEDWPTAVYCAGVLSRCFMDPLRPFHTARSAARRGIHRAAEIGVSQSYGALYRLGLDRFGDIRIELGSDPDWLAVLVCRGAERANGCDERLIARYDIGRGTLAPPAGLDPVARRIAAEMIRFAYLGYARVLGRAIDDARVPAPAVGLAGASLLAAVQAPAMAFARHRAYAAERRTLEGMNREWVYADTVGTPQPSQVVPFRPRERAAAHIEPLREKRRHAGMPASADIIPLRAAGRGGAAPVPSAAAPAWAANVTREPMLFLVPGGPSDEGRTLRTSPRTSS